MHEYEFFGDRGFRGIRFAAILGQSFKTVQRDRQGSAPGAKQCATYGTHEAFASSAKAFLCLVEAAFEVSLYALRIKEGECA